MYATLFFSQGDEASALLDRIADDVTAPLEIVRELSADYADFPAYDDLEFSVDPSWGSSDTTFARGCFVLAWNNKFGYVSLNYRKD